MANESNPSWKDMNKCVDWALNCREMKGLSNGAVSLHCYLPGKPKKNKGVAVMKDGKPVYAKSMNVSVYCDPSNCKVEQIDYTNQRILVTGQFSVDDYPDKQTGEPRPQYTIFATEIKLAPAYQKNQNQNQNQNQN